VLYKVRKYSLPLLPLLVLHLPIQHHPQLISINHLNIPHRHSNLQESHIIGTSLNADNIFFETSNSKPTDNFAMSTPEGMVNVVDESTPQIPITEKVENHDPQPLPLSLPSVYYWWRCHMCSRTYMDAGHACSCGHIKCRLCRWGYS
jgi:hypothetical protein